MKEPINDLKGAAEDVGLEPDLIPLELLDRNIHATFSRTSEKEIWNKNKTRILQSLTFAIDVGFSKGCRTMTWDFFGVGKRRQIDLHFLNSE